MCKILQPCIFETYNSKDPVFSLRPICKVQNARSCIFAHVQDIAFLHIKFYKDPDLTSLLPLRATWQVQGIGKHAKFCILANLSMQESRTYFLSPPLCQVQSARSGTFTQVQDFAFLHIKDVQVPRHSVLSPPIYKVQSERSCTFAHLQDFAILHIKNVQVLKHYVFSPPTCKV